MGVTVLAMHPQGEEQAGVHRLMLLVDSGGERAPVSLHPSNFRSHDSPSVSLSVRSYFFEPNQFLSLDLSQKAKNE